MLNSLLSTEIDQTGLTLWTTQHPCLMCAAAIQFIELGQVCFIADDPSDWSSPEAVAHTRGAISYQALGNPLWWTISNLIFLYTPALLYGEETGNLRQNRDRYPELVRLVLEVVQQDRLGHAARSNTGLSDALMPYTSVILHTATFAPRSSS